jgi:hypothetical protein
MRRLVLAALVVGPLALLTPGASAQELPCKYWVHGCDFAAYVRDFCAKETHRDCGIV